jgi:hypothetical protein
MEEADLCILIPTFPACADVAEFTVSRIKKFWPGHPPMFLCGLKEKGIPTTSPDADWMTIVAEACDDLWRREFRKVYLLLDDHPPLGPCHSLHLNQTLPSILQDLGAVSIALLGTGQGRRPFGTRIVVDGFSFDHVNPRQLWKFPLHPALWNLEILRGLLREMIRFLPLEQRTPWAFERWGGAPDAPLPTEWKSGSYRIHGHSMRVRTLHPFVWAARRITRALELTADLFGKGNVIRSSFGFVRHFYDGPYPLLWSGLMRKKQVNPDFLSYLQLVARQDFLENIPPRFLRYLHETCGHDAHSK